MLNSPLISETVDLLAFQQLANSTGTTGPASTELRLPVVTAQNVDALSGTIQNCWHAMPGYPLANSCISWWPSSAAPNKFEQAFKVAAMLLKEGLVAECSVSEFVEVVRKIESSL